MLAGAVIGEFEGSRNQVGPLSWLDAEEKFHVFPAPEVVLRSELMLSVSYEYQMVSPGIAKSAWVSVICAYTPV
jgi:hypothetical protein